MKSASAVCLVFLLLFGGCEGMTKEKVATGVGGVIGAATGILIGGTTKDKQKGQVIGGVLGGVAGMVIGAQIGKMLDEQDRKKHEEATAKALETGKNQSWQSPNTGASGQITVNEIPPATVPSSTQVSNSVSPEQPTAEQIVYQARQCRTLTQTIKLKDGTSRTEDLTACKGPNGWEAV